MTVKAMKKMLKKAGMKTSGKKAALTRRVKKAHLKGGGGEETMGGRRRYRKHGGGGTCMVNGVADPNIAEADCTGEGKEWHSSDEVGLSNSGGRRRRGTRRGVFGKLF